MAELEDSQNNPTMEEILQTIRGVIAGEVEGDAPADDDDVLELTEIADDDTSTGKDVLANIDDALASPAAEEDAGELTKRLQEALAAEAAEESPSPVSEELPEEPALEAVATPEEMLATPEPEPEPEPVSIPESPAVFEMKEEPKPITPDIPEPSVVKTMPIHDSSDTLVSEQSVEASADAIRELMSHIPKQGPSLRSGSTMEDLVIEAMRPYLKDWLDNNLPALVKRLVEKEIRRLVPNSDE